MEPEDYVILDYLDYAIVWHCLHDPTFSHFSRTPTCHRQTHDYRIYRASMASRGKNWLLCWETMKPGLREATQGSFLRIRGICGHCKPRNP